MKSLYLLDVLTRLESSAPVGDFLARMADGRFPVDCGGVEGAYTALLAALCRMPVERQWGQRVFAHSPTSPGRLPG